ncbi:MULTISPECIES: thioredoxin family protein [Holospora]|uniref:Thioredoxin n=2 Tax=Holospora TaxID=44747 RepID=A0A061JH60_9PROT|nr:MULTISPECIES: thioredoxin domain-containing protein [Holospora]ETZ05480.1 thioredoxin [Holospora undulata HU1]GAJ46667.1 thioredoxin [Holospora elegans E1]
MENLNYVELIAESSKTHNVLIDFFATWCPPCQALVPILESLSKDAAWLDFLKIIKINIDQNPSIATKYRIQSLPTLVLIPKHPQEVQEVARHIGGISEKALIEWLNFHQIQNK